MADAPPIFTGLPLTPPNERHSTKPLRLRRSQLDQKTRELAQRVVVFTFWLACNLDARDARQQRRQNHLGFKSQSTPTIFARKPPKSGRFRKWPASTTGHEGSATYRALRRRTRLKREEPYGPFGRLFPSTVSINLDAR